MNGEKILDCISAGVLVVDDHWRVLYANAGAVKILRMTGAELQGQRLPQLFNLEEAELAAQLPDVRREVNLEIGAPAQIIGFSVSAPCEVGCRTVLFQEINGILALRRERDRLLQLAALGDTLPSILHELRNPLAAVTNTLELCIEEAPDSVRDDLHAILREVRRMSLMLQAVGGLARPIHVDRWAAIDLAVSEACRILEVSARTRGIEIVAKVDTLPLLQLDWGVVSGVVFNLVKNAIDACRRGDTITVEARLSDQQTFVLSVRDTGTGMTPQVLTRCRELFFTSKEKGSGIGLALCQEIAEKSGGHLDIESALGVGTVVTLSVPAINPINLKGRRTSSCLESTT